MATATRRILGIGALLALLPVCTAILAIVLSERLPAVQPQAFPLESHPPFRTWDQHNAIYQATDFPFIVHIETGDGALFYAGVQHSSNPQDPQFQALRRAWDDFQPTVALNEGRSRYAPVTPDLFGGFNDPMLVYVLAKRDAVPVFTLEPAYEDEVRVLLEAWPPDLVAAYFSWRVILSEAGGDPDKAESVAPGLIAKRTDVEGLRGALSGVEDLDRIWRRHAEGEPDWRNIPHIDAVEWLKPIGEDSRAARGRHMVRALAGLVLERERVFAVVGASHVIRQEPTLRSLIAQLR